MNSSIINFTRRDQRRYRQRRQAEHVQVQILRGMTREMPPLQAMVFMGYFHQWR